MSTFRKTAVAVAVMGSLLVGVGVGVGVGAGTAQADGGTPAPGRNSAGDGAQALCKRVPKIEKRIERSLRRIDGAADARGSIARLEKRVAAAEAAGHTEVHTFLKNRLAARKALKPTLEQRQKDLAEVKKYCEADRDGDGN